MKKISFISSSFSRNECFSGNYKSRDDFLFFITNLKQKFNTYGYDISTDDINEPEKSDLILQAGLQKKPDKNLDINKSYLLILESPHVDKGLIDTTNHKYFKKIFTWNDALIDNKKYFKVNYSYRIPNNIPKTYEGKKLVCLIAGNKYSNHPKELYSSRREFIKWFETNSLKEFDLYGTKWNQYRFGHSFLGKIFNKIKILRKEDLYPSYKGVISNKFDTLKKYKFSICFENIKDQPGYITEKIFDSFFAGCIPIYLGANNIEDYIPQECFIDMRNFESYNDCYQFIKNIDENVYTEYLNAIESFLQSNQVEQFTAEFFANTIVNQMINN